MSSQSILNFNKHLDITSLSKRVNSLIAMSGNV